MTRRRWIADEVSGDTAALVGEHAAHLARVLRAEVGQEFDIATGDDIRRGTITTISYDRVEFALGVKAHRKRKLTSLSGPPKITLALAIFKFDRMEWAIEKCTEIGVARIIPVIARRSDAHLAAAAVKRHERWLRIVRQAAEQSRRAAPPEIAAPVKLKELGSVVSAESATRVVLAESKKTRVSRMRCNPRPAKSRSPWAPKADGPTENSPGSTTRDGSRLRSATQFCERKPPPLSRRRWPSKPFFDSAQPSTSTSDILRLETQRGYNRSTCSENRSR